MQQELITEIHRIATSPAVITVNGNISKPNKRDFKNRDKCYIILIPDGNIESLKTKINRRGEGRDKFTRLWNSKARLLWLEQINSQCRNK